MKIPLHSRAAGAGLFLALALAASAQTSAPPPTGLATGDDHADYESSESTGGDRTGVMSGNRVEAGEKITGDLRAVMGSNWVSGAVSHDVVAIMGSDTIDGSVGHDVVAVMGSVTINGTVGHNVKAVMGNVTLGPNAVVRGDITCVNGSVHRAPGAVVRGRIISQPYGSFGQPDIVWRHDHGRTDWVEGFHNFLGTWRWLVTLVFLGFYALLALIFPRAVQRCGDVLAERPAWVVLSALAALLAVPLVFVLLLITIIGIPVAVLLLPVGILFCAMFGKAGIYGLVGRSISQGRLHSAAAVLVGGALCAPFYFVPFAGLLILIFVSILGFGCALTALLTASRGVPPAAPAPAPSAEPSAVPATPPPPAPPAVAAAVEPAPGIVSGAPAPVAPAIPVTSAGLPRAGFWIRIGGLFIDGLMISAVFGDTVINQHVVHEGIHLAGANCLLPLAIYAALMWKFKGTTIGGMICGLRVVRLDDKPLEWDTVIVRALGCFLSAIFALGFFWIAFDPEKQSWHDKLAGTVVVRTKGVKLV